MLIEIFLCKWMWIARKIRMLPKHRPIYELLNNYLWCYVALFLLQSLFIFCASFKVEIFLEKNLFFVFPILSIIPSFFTQRYYRKRAKKKHIFYNKEYMQNKWSIPLFILTLIFTFGGGCALFILIFV